jgi:hypothetical protein
MKKLLCSLCLSLLILSASAQNLKWIKFKWEGDSLGKRYFDKAAILIPTKLENLPYQFETQFDLGAINSILYGNSLAPYLSLNKRLKDKLDTALITWIQSQKYPTLKNVLLRLDNVSLGKNNFGLFLGYGDSLTLDSVKTKTVKLIGTIGPDIFQGKVLIIDYPNQRICVTDKIPLELMNGTNFVDILIQEGRIKIPFQIGGSKKYLLFDTGSSRYALHTTKRNADDIAGRNEAVVDSICGDSWGMFSCSYGKKTDVEVKIGSAIMPKNYVYFDSSSNMDMFFLNENIWGITGNAYFLNNIVIIDYKNQKFGLRNTMK